MRLIPEYTPVDELHLCFVHEFFNTRFHFGQAICQIIKAAHKTVEVEVWASAADQPYFQAECQQHLDGSEAFSLSSDSSGRGFLAEYLPIFAEDDHGNGVALIFRNPRLEQPDELKGLALRLAERHGFRVLDLGFDFSTAQLLVNEELVLISEAAAAGPDRQTKLDFFTRTFPGQHFYTVPPLAGDVTNDLDMFLWPVGPHRWIVSEYPAGTPQAESIDPALAILKQHGHEVYRVPGLPPMIYDDINTIPTYANGVIINRTALVPAYGRPEDLVVHDLIKSIGFIPELIDCSKIILSNGAIHCISKTIPRAGPGKIYHIRAHLMCHDVRLNTWIDIDLTFDHIPGEEEVKPFLWPEIDQVLIKNWCEGCNYDILEIQIT